MSRLLPIGVLEFSGQAWPREGPDDERVTLFAELYASDGSGALPPIEVIRRSTARYLVADGHHRWLAAVRAGFKEIPVEILPIPDGADPFRVAHRRGLETARTSSKPLTLQERKKAAYRLLKEESELSDREVARLSGLSHQGVGRLKQRLSAGVAAPAEAALYTATQSADDVARRLVKGLSQLWDSRGLSDMLLADRPGKRLAVALRERHGNGAVEWSTRLLRWSQVALAELQRQ